MKKMMVWGLSGALLFNVAAAESGLTGEWVFSEADLMTVAPRVGTVPARLLNVPDAYEWSDGALTLKTPQPGGRLGGVFFGKPVVDFTRPFTVLTVVKFREEVKAGKGYRSFKDIFANTGTRGPGARLTFFYGGIQFNSGDGVKPAAVITNPAQTPVPIGEYVQLGVTYDGTTIRIYMNGERVAEKAIQVSASERNLMLGCNNGSAYPLPGAIRSFKVYDRMLADGEIGAEYLKTLK